MYDNKRRIYDKEYREKNKEKYNQIRKEHNKKYRKELFNISFNIYGNKCQNCGNKDTVVLEWHHVKGRKNSTAIKSEAIMREIRDVGKMLLEYELLCSNCHIHADIRDGTHQYKKRIKTNES